MATKKDTENNNPSAPVPADNDITMLTMVTKQNWDEAIKDESGVLYSKDGKRLIGTPNNRPTSYLDTLLRKVPFYWDASDYDIKEGTEIICDDAFCGCEWRLASITIPPSVTTIGNGAFQGCQRLNYIDIHTSVTRIGDKAFGGCDSLDYIDIPPSVTTMEGNPFWRWHGHIEIDSPYFKYENGALIDVNKGVLIAFCSDADSCIIPSSVTRIGDTAF